MKQEENKKSANKQLPRRKFNRTLKDLFADIETILNLKFNISNKQTLPVKVRESEERFYKRYK